MSIESIIKFIKAVKPNQCYFIGGTLITAGIAGNYSPFWFPLLDDLLRNHMDIATNSKVNDSGIMTESLSKFCMIVGALIIIIHRYLNHCETIESKPIENNVVKFRVKEEPSAFEAHSGGSVVINGGKVRNYSKVAKATNNGVIQLNDTDVEK